MQWRKYAWNSDSQSAMESLNLHSWQFSFSRKTTLQAKHNVNSINSKIKYIIAYDSTAILYWNLEHVLDYNSEIGAHVRRNICYLICVRHLFQIESSHKSDILFPKRPIFLHTWTTCSELPSNISTKYHVGVWNFLKS